MASSPTIIDANGIQVITADSNASISLGPTGIVIQEGLVTPPLITGQIGYTGFTTTNPNGIQFGSSLDMNGQNIWGVDDLTATTINGLPIGGAQNLTQVLNVGQDAGNQAITNLNGIGIAGGTSLYNNALTFTGYSGAIMDVSTINNVAYPPPVSVPALSSVLGVGNTTGGASIDFGNNSNIDNVLNINGSAYPPYPIAPYGLSGVLNISNDAVGASMTGINNIDLVNINGVAYPPAGPSTPDWASVLNQGATANQSIDMGANSINNCDNINLSSINNIPFLPAKFSNVFQTFSIGSVGSGTTNVYGGSSSVTIPVGNYQITYSIQFDGSILQSGGQIYSIKAYCWLQGVSVGQVYPYKVNQGFAASSLMSYNSGYPTCISVTDFIQISIADSFQLGVYQENELGQSANNLFLSAVMIEV